MRVVVIGAGLTGLMAAQQLHNNRHSVVVLDKGKSPGGRLATRRIGDATLDHGAQFFTVRESEFEHVVQQWVQAGVVREWCKGFATQDGHPRYIGTHGMNGIAKHLALGLDVRCSTFVFEVTRNEDTSWTTKIDDGTVFQSDALVVTCPLPQAYSLLITAHVDIPEALSKCEYDRTLGLLAVLDGESGVPAPGGVQNANESLQFVADNYMKGISHIPALTLHFSPAFSEQHWDDEPQALHQLLIHHAQPFLGTARIAESQVKKWRFATPRTPWPERIWQHESLVIAGDAMSGPKVEGAALSGLAAANVTNELQN
jgi:predicted NAD/FAD-dependent oxidoreductase